MWCCTDERKQSPRTEQDCFNHDCTLQSSWTHLRALYNYRHLKLIHFPSTSTSTVKTKPEVLESVPCWDCTCLSSCRNKSILFLCEKSVSHVLLVLLLKLVPSGCHWGDMKEKLWFWQTRHNILMLLITRWIGARFKGNVSVRSRETDSGSQRHDSIKCVSLRRNKRSWCKLTYSPFLVASMENLFQRKNWMWIISNLHLSDAFIQSDLQLHSGYTFSLVCVPWESNPQPFALLTQCSTTEPHRNIYLAIYFFIKQNKINQIHAYILLTALWSQRN